MLRIWIISAALLFGVLSLTAQEQKIIKGTITDKRTGDAVPYANIGIEGTYWGAASNADGYFEFKVPTDNTIGSLFASAVGYEAFRTDLASLNTASLTIQLEPTAYDIGEVSVSANSLVLLKTIRDAVDAISSNYEQGPLSMSAYYKYEESVDNQPVRVDEAIVELSDASGYKRENPLKEQQNRNYRVTETRRNFDVKKLADGMKQLDNLLTCDVVRTRRNLLDNNFLQNWDLSADPTEKYEGRDAWIINYTINKPDFEHTGIFNVTSYHGKIYISKEDKAILRNELWIQVANPSQHGWSIATERAKASMAEYEIMINYRKSGTKYFPSFTKMVSRETSTDKNSEATQTVTSESYLLPLSTETFRPKLLDKRDYYSEVPFNKNFWESFTLAVE